MDVQNARALLPAFAARLGWSHRLPLAVVVMQAGMLMAHLGGLKALATGLAGAGATRCSHLLARPCGCRTVWPLHIRRYYLWMVENKHDRNVSLPPAALLSARRSLAVLRGVRASGVVRKSGKLQ